MVSGFVAIPLLIKALGIEGFGVYSTVIAALGFSGILDLGFSIGVNKFVAEAIHEGNRDRLEGVISSAIASQILLGAFVAFLLILFSEKIVGLLKIPNELWEAALWAFRITSVGVPASLVFSILIGALNGMELFSRSSLIVAGISVLSSVGNVLLAFFGYSIVYLALLNLFLTLCAIIGISLFLKSRFDRIRIFLHFVRDEWYRVFAFGSYLTLSRLYAFSVDPMLRLFVGITFGPVAVAYYAVPSKLLSSINVLFNKVAEVLMPRTARALSARDNESVYRMFLVAMKANLILSTALFLGIAICSRIILRVWVGASFADQGWIVMVPLCFSYMISAQTTIPWTIALGGGLSKLQAGFALLSFLVLSALIYPAANLIGVSGPACAFLASSFLGYFAISRISLRVFGVGTLSLIKGIQSTSLAPVLRGLFR